MRWLVVGSDGMLGQDLVAMLSERGENVLAPRRSELDVTVAVAPWQDVDVVVNCAAYTAVDKAESEEPVAFALNAVGASHVARAARATGARLVHISTDYVFDGHATAPYSEDAPLAPRSAYGRTKGAGEWAVRADAPDSLIVRTAWLYGAHGNCFPRTIVRAARERGVLEVITDQVGQPTWTADLADLVYRLVAAEVPAGMYHGTSSGQTSWHGFASAAVAAAGLDPAIVAETTSDRLVRPAPRPAYSVLGHEALERVGVAPIGEWQERWQVAAPVVLHD